MLTSSEFSTASQRRHCCASQMTEVHRQSAQLTHLLEYPNDARALVGWLIIVELGNVHSMSQDFRGASSGAMQGASGCRLEEDSLEHTHITTDRWLKAISQITNHFKTKLKHLT